ncbi:tRNA (guanosine(37)-N1)-methyltransferase TrmD [Gammaproteobacteria bacterium]|nr:tRNA (guanosine(37)-N1)-methyltransferase TrmD [Gammaproteobacteria bacterium]
MNFTFISLFPEIIRSALNESITKRAIEKSLISFETINPRDYLKPKERIDDKVYGGGPGMLLKSEPLMKAIDDATSKFDRSESKIIYLSPKGKPFTQETAETLALEKNIIFICGRYEGIDQRIIDHYVDDEISIGDYVLSGGELPALVVFDAITRNIEGVLGDDSSLEQESFSGGLLEYPQYTRPEKMKLGDVPKELLSGNHAVIEQWRKKQMLGITSSRRKDLLEKITLSPEEKALLEEFFDELE